MNKGMRRWLKMDECKNCGCEVYEWAKRDVKAYKVIHNKIAEHNLRCKCRKPELNTSSSERRN